MDSMVVECRISWVSANPQLCGIMFASSGGRCLLAQWKESVPETYTYHLLITKVFEFFRCLSFIFYRKILT